MDLIVAIFPIALLIFIMTKPKSWPAHIALPFVAVLVIVLQLFYSQADGIDVAAMTAKGALTALTPIMVIYGAVFLFRTQENIGAMNIIRQWLLSITDNRVAQVMLIGWAFAFLIEGASGFGTPAALAAPILVGLGFSPLSVAMACLVFNSVPVSFGAVGTPTWFGFSGIVDLSVQETMRIGFKSAIIHGAAGLIIPILALRFLFSWQEIRRNILFILLSILSCTIPMVLVSNVSYEFPSLMGGAIGLLISMILAKNNVGLSSGSEGKSTTSHLSFGVILKNTFPLWATVLVLVVTRIPGLGLKEWLTFDQWVLWQSSGEQDVWRIFPALVVHWQQIFGTETSWRFQALYVPGLIPFVFVSLMAMLWFRSGTAVVWNTFKQTNQQMARPALALIGSLIFVGLLMMGGDDAYVMKIGIALADVFGRHWSLAASYLGALGSFFLVPIRFLI